MLEASKESLTKERFINKLEARRPKLEIRSLRLTINQYCVFARNKILCGKKI